MARTFFLSSTTLLLLLLFQYCSVYIAILTVSSVAAQTNISTDQSALLALKSHITIDAQNILTTNWSTSNSDICNWVGVTCSVHHLRVTALNLSYMGLTGTIPPHLGNLSFLVALEFRNNSFGGTLPTELSHLRRLKFISFGFNEFKGTIPSWFGSLSKLQTLDLYGNQFSGSIPNAIFNLSALQVLNLRNNELSGTIPREVEKLTMLQEILLGYNNFEGSIAREIGNLTMLKRIFLDFNMFEEIPNLIGSKDQVERLFVQGNALKGHIPVVVFNMSSLTILALAQNNLSGSLPDNICQHLPSIQLLNLADNQFDGPLPHKLWQCTELLNLVLAFNNFNGSIPRTIGNLTQLTELYISNTTLTGEIPEGGPFTNFSALSFVSNKALCGAARLHVPPCKNNTLQPSSRKATSSNLKYIIPAIIIATVFLAFVAIFILHRKRKVEVATEATLLPQSLWRRVSHLELLRATNGFNNSNLLGSGGFGSVYKGTLSDGIDVAVKIFDLQLEGAFKSFERECEMLSNIRHRNLIKIISCCSQLDFKGLVLNYMPNGSLEKWLYSQNSSFDILKRLNIMVDVALALEYLHHGYSVPIVHCDLKPSNILLDDDMVAHVADFGIAKLLGLGDSMTRTMTLATVGYMAPEYGMDGIVSTQGDVYSFGIVVMETFTKMKPTNEMFVEEMNLKQWVANSLLSEAIAEVVDANLLVAKEEDHDYVTKIDCLSSIMRLALACCAEPLDERINMQEVVATLKKTKIKFLKDVGRRVLLNRPRVQAL
ncbi:probable LRR receptor-like serine/threonine-protein kinase At3g47570 isoform X2 [Malus sylvestris]|uniref:probable LRR receptor-like serine/threonine-protein kinase At3g47570 isoform X2 n=1 Tax=Malus sylvestris TaxID=3752 RepID=UPI0021AC0149|nr:probable LRR receptor-like serine/threonine-protein kinase At3g47570 isoform X2 [Malus sylvestris]